MHSESPGGFTYQTCTQHVCKVAGATLSGVFSTHRPTGCLAFDVYLTCQHKVVICMHEVSHSATPASPSRRRYLYVMALPNRLIGSFPGWFLLPIALLYGNASRPSSGSVRSRPLKNLGF